MSVRNLYFDIYNPNIIYALFYMSMTNNQKSPAIEFASFEMCDNNQLVVKSNYSKFYGFYAKNSNIYQVTSRKIVNMMKIFFKNAGISEEDLENSKINTDKCHAFFLEKPIAKYKMYYIKYNDYFSKIIKENGGELKFSVPIYQLYIAYEYFKGKNAEKLTKIFGKEAVEKTLMSPLNPMEIEYERLLTEEKNKLIEEFETKKNENEESMYEEIKLIKRKFKSNISTLEEELIKEIRKLDQQFKEIKTTA